MLISNLIWKLEYQDICKKECIFAINYSQPLLPIEKCVLESSELEQINNPQYCIEYSKEIFSYLRSNESLNMPIYSNSILSKGEISERSRKILLDWIV